MTIQSDYEFHQRMSEAQNQLKEKFVYYYAMHLLFDEIKSEFALLYELDRLGTIAAAN